MPKRLRDEPIYLAPEILAFRNVNYEPVVTDERTGKKLNPFIIDDKIYIYKRQVEEWFLTVPPAYVKGRITILLLL